LRIALVVLMASLLSGCPKRGPAPPPSSTGSTAPAPAAPTASSITGKKYYTSIKKDQVDRTGSAEIQTEQQVVAILGEPSERSATRSFTNRHGNFTEYDLLWLKAEGEPVVKVTFLNGRKTGVFASVH
jgi:hypothetical protein